MSDDDLLDALDGLFAYDTGAVDSGIHDESLRARCIAELRRRVETPPDHGRLWLSRLIRDMWLSEDALAQGSGIEDVVEFIRWLDDRMDVSL